MSTKQKRKVKPKFRPYNLISDAVETGLQFAMNRLEDHGVKITEEQRAGALDSMLNEVMLSLGDIIEF